MGQQQLLLLVVGIVIVGLAVVVGIQAFGENQRKATLDALVNDTVRIAADAQAWVLKPSVFGGGNGVPTNVTLEKMGYTVTSGQYTNANATYAMSGAATAIVIGGSNAAGTAHVAAAVYGTSPQCIATAVGSTAPGPPAKPAACTADLDW